MAKSQSFAWTAPLIIETGANPIMVQFLLKELHYHINAQRQLAQAFYERFLQLPPPCAGVTLRRWVTGLSDLVDLVDSDLPESNDFASGFLL